LGSILGDFLADSWAIFLTKHLVNLHVSSTPHSKLKPRIAFNLKKNSGEEK
jgi:hypothetical protein